MLAQDSREVSSLAREALDYCEAGAVACMFECAQTIERP